MKRVICTGHNLKECGSGGGKMNIIASELLLESGARFPDSCDVRDSLSNPWGDFVS